LFYRSYVVLDIEKIKDDILSIDGIDEKIAQKLKYAGIRSISDLELQDPHSLSNKIGYPVKSVSYWIQQAIDIKKYEEVKKSEEKILKLKEILNISYQEAKLLRNVGVFSIEDLINEEPILLAEDTKISVNYIKFWIKKAKKYFATKKEEEKTIMEEDKKEPKEEPDKKIKKADQKSSRSYSKKVVKKDFKPKSRKPYKKSYKNRSYYQAKRYPKKPSNQNSKKE